MSWGSFVFTPTALRSLQLDEDMLERYKYKKQLASHHLNSYMLRKEARDRTLQLRSSTVLPAAVCQDVVVQNALYTGDLEAMQHLFPRGSMANLIIEPQGGDMRWVATGEGKRQHLYSLGIHLGTCMIWESYFLLQQKLHSLPVICAYTSNINTDPRGSIERHSDRIFIETEHVEIFIETITSTSI